MFYGIDGEYCEISQGYSSFVFSWGLAVGTSSHEGFQKRYTEIIESLKQKYNLTTNRKVYCSYELKKELQDEEKAREFIADFESRIQDEIEKVIVTFSFFPEKDEITSFTDQEPSKLDVKDFHKRHLGDYYEHICAWEIFDTQGDVEKIVADGFQGYRTRAWDELRPNLDSFRMIHMGDQVSPLISTADLLLDKLQKDFEEKNEWIGKDQIKTYYQEQDFDIFAEYLGNSLLALLTPTKNRHIPTHKLVKEPVYMIIRPDTSKIGRKELIDSPQGIELQNQVFEENGSLKFYNSREDKDKLNFESTIVYVGEEGKDEAETLVNEYGYNLDLKKFRQL